MGTAARRESNLSSLWGKDWSLTSEMVRKVGLDVDHCILPGLLFDPDAMGRAIDDTTVRSDSDPPAHDPAIAPSSSTILASAYSPVSPEVSLRALSTRGTMQ